MNKQILLGAHPDEKSFSMEVYRVALLRAMSRLNESGSDFWPDNPSIAISKAGRIKRAYSKYSWYPRFVKSLHNYELVHFLDHSSAHLIDAVPKGLIKVVTVHDLIPLVYSGGLSAKQVQRFRKSIEKIHDADAVIAVSEYTKKEILLHTDVDDSKIHVIPNGVEKITATADVRKKIREAIGANRKSKIILSVSSCLERKNLKILPEAIKEMKKSFEGKVTLVRVGGLLDSTLREKLTVEIKEGQLIELGRLSEEELWAVYKEADILFFPSFYEGFGLPILEGLISQCRVVCSDATSLPEVGGGFAQYFDPKDPVAAGLALAGAAAESGPCLIEGQRYAEKFTWERAARALQKTYYQLNTSNENR